MKRIRRSRILAVESLENRHLLSVEAVPPSGGVFDPSPFEQEMLEHLNRMRLSPQAELDVLFTDVESATARDPDARLAMTVYQDPSPEEIASEWAALSPAAPLAWNESLYDAAYDHTTLMVHYDDQSHLLPGELSLAQRLAAAGYQGGAVGENVFAYMNNVFHGHSAFSIDWGVPSRSHRDNMMASTFREIGISIVTEENADTQVGPLLVTQDYGDGRNLTDSYLLGVVWHDVNGNGWYDAGEGYNNVELQIEGTGGTFSTASMTAGGYQTFVPAGLYTVTAYGGELPSPMVVRDVSIGSENVKVDFEYDPNQSLAPLVDLNGPGEAGIDFQTSFYEGSPEVPIVAVDGFVSDDDDQELVSLTATLTNLRDPGEYLVADTTGTPILANYDAPSGVLSLTGTAALADYRQVLATLSYGNLTTGPDETPRVVEVEAFDGTFYSATAEATVYVVRTTLPELTIDDLRVEEHSDGVTTYEFTVEMSDTMTRTVTVDFATEDGSAVAGEDYTSVQRSLQFAPGETVKTVLVTVTDDEVPEGEESFIGRLSNPVGATIADGIGTVTIVDDDVAMKLGAVDFLGIQGVDLTGESPLYRMTTARDGILSVEASGQTENQISLVLYDQYRSANAVITVDSIDGVARFDLPDVSPDETYYLEITGDASDADVLLANVVREENSAIIVAGTGGDDVLGFEAGGALQFTFNGLAYSYPWEQAESLEFRGGDGEDQADLTGSAGDDAAQLFPGRGTLSNGSYSVTLNETEVIHISSGGGSDTGQLYDSPGSDAFVADGNVGALSGEGFVNSITDFNTVLAYGTAGGEDSAHIEGTDAYEEFIGKPDVTKVVSEGRYLRTKYFDHVSVIGNGGNDFARIYGNEGAEHFVGLPNSGEMVGEGFHYRVEDYFSVHGYSRGKTGDTAVLSDSSGDDTLIVSPVFAKVYGEGFLVRAKFFPNVEIAGTGEGVDKARLYDSEGDDSVVLAAAESRIYGPGYDRQIRGFDEVTAYSQEGGRDTAWMYDTPGDDTFRAEVGEAVLDGGGFLARAYGFGEVLAYATAGGSDTATLQDSVGNDDFYSDPAVSWIAGSGYFARVKFFETVDAYSSAGGYDTARFYADDSDSVFWGSPTLSTMEEGNVHRRAEAFEAVYADAGSALDSAIFEGSGRDDDLFETGDDWSRLSNETLGVLVEARQFEAVTGPFDGGEAAV